MDKYQIEQALRCNYLFAHLGAENLDHVAAHSRLVRLDEGGSLFEQGDPVKAFYLVIAGRIKLYRLSPDGQEKIIEVAVPGQTFAEALMFMSRPQYPVGASALERSQVISIDTREFSEVLRRSVDTCFLVMGELSQRLRGLIGKSTT